MKPSRKGAFQPTGCWIRPEKRLAIYLRDRFTCLLCCKDLHGADAFDITLDHVISKSAGGGNGSDNVYTCCRSCNCSRQDKPIERTAGPATRAHIRRNLKMVLTKYVKLAKQIRSGDLTYTPGM